jgi:branched-chain amino acid transport system permease protein
MRSFLPPRLLASPCAKILGWTLVAAVLFFPFFVLQAVDQNGVMSLAAFTYRPYLLAVFGVFLALCGVFFLPAPLRALGQSCPDFAVSDVQKKGLQVLLVVGLLILPLVSNRAELDLATVVLLSIALAWGMTIVVGYAGLLDLGYIAFYAVGAYAYALLSTGYGVSFWAALPLCALLPAVLAFLVGFPILRLRGDYFAIVTLGFAEIVRTLLINAQSITGGPNGVAEIPRPTLFGWGAADLDERMMMLYVLALAWAAVVYGLMRRLRVLPLGRAWEALREDEIAARSLGVNVHRMKLSAHGIGAMIAGICGAFFAAKQGFVSPESFTFLDTAFLLAMVVLGGMGSPWGVALAAILIVALPEVSRSFADYRMLFFGMVMVLVMIFRPGGFATARRPSVLYKPASGEQPS